jgi:phosphoketolase
MLYLQDNPLLREPLKIEHVKPRMLGHTSARKSSCGVSSVGSTTPSGTGR